LRSAAAFSRKLLAASKLRCVGLSLRGVKARRGPCRADTSCPRRLAPCRDAGASVISWRQMIRPRRWGHNIAANAGRFTPDRVRAPPYAGKDRAPVPWLSTQRCPSREVAHPPAICRVVTLSRALRIAFRDDKIVRVDVIADPARLRQLHIAALDH
jgi:hypothetical protein